MPNAIRKALVNRRHILAGAMVGAASACLPMPAVSQGLRKLKMTLPWLPQGSQFFAFVARHQGMWRKRGLDVDVVRGFGSVPALQTVLEAQNEVGIIAAPTILVSAAQGVDTRVVGVIGYDATMGIMVLDDSPVRSLKDLEGRRLGSSPGAAELAFVDPYLARSDVDPKKVSRVSLQANVLESSLLNKQVDAITAFATSNMPNMLAQGVKVRFFPYSAAGLVIYSNCLTTTPKFLSENRQVVEAWVDGLVEAVKFCLSNFDTAVENFLAEVPQMRMTATGATHARYGAGFFLATVLKPEMREHGIGWASLPSLNNQTDLVMEFIAAKGAKRPAIDKIFTNEMVGKVRLTDAEWAAAQQLAKPYEDLLNFRS
jgi:ABC-type nitrate/sulfonate/bicarbonate transport system substrate-binding protein